MAVMATPITSPWILLSLLGILCGVKLVLTLYNGLINPLKKIPGPYHTRFTNLRLKLAIITGRRMYYVDSLHRRYGPMVRLTPTEVAVSDLTSFQTIHKIGSGFNKTAWYSQLTQFDRPMVFTMTDPRAHAGRRKMLARGFSKSYLRATWEGAVREKVELTVRKMREEGSGGLPVNILKWWTFMATDVSSLLMFGESFHAIEKGEADYYIKTLEATMQGSGIGVELPLVRWIGSRLPFDVCKQMFKSKPFLMTYGTDAIRGSKSRGDTANVFARIIEESGKGEILDERDVVCEATGLIVAGSDTTGNTLTYLVWAILSRPELRMALEEELATLPEKYTDQDLETLPLLGAIIEETLRLYGAAPGGLPREVPPAGTTLAEYYIPGGTTVTTQAYTIHRDDNIFPNAAEFNPHRWLDTTPQGIGSKKDLGKIAHHPFGAGSRICIGIHLAQMELRLATAEFFRRCKGARLAPSTTAQSMEMENFFLIAPQSHRCDILIDS